MCSRGRGRGALKSLVVVAPGSFQEVSTREPTGSKVSKTMTVDTPDSDSLDVLEARVTEVLDVTSFWAQLGKGRAYVVV